MRSRIIIIGEAETIGKTHRIQVFGPDIGGKRLDPEMKEKRYIRQVFQFESILGINCPITGE